MDARPTVCPLCEHAQAGGLECEQCGRPFGDSALRATSRSAAARPASRPAAGRPGRRRSGRGASPSWRDASAAAPEPIEALEHNSLAADGRRSGAGAGGARPGRPGADALDPSGLELDGDLERTLAARVEVATTGRRTSSRPPGSAGAGDAVRAPALGVVCRYCHAEALPGETLCGRCGMRLPVPLAPTGAGGAGGPLLLLRRPGPRLALPGLRRPPRLKTGRVVAKCAPHEPPRHPPTESHRARPTSAAAALAAAERRRARQESFVSFRAYFRCGEGCDVTAELTEVIYRCPKCGGLLEVEHDVAGPGARGPPTTGRRSSTSASRWGPGRSARGCGARRSGSTRSSPCRQRGLDVRGRQPAPPGGPLRPGDRPRATSGSRSAASPTPAPSRTWA